METFHRYAVFDLLSFILRHRLSVVLFMVVAVAPSALTIEEVAEYCEWESFNATCASDEVILIRSARYGRMKIGRCLPSFYPGQVCSKDVTSELDRQCSGRNRCSFLVISMNAWHCGSRDFKNFLEASYECRKVANGRFHTCTNESTIVLPVAESDILASTFASTGSEPCQFVIRVHSHQRINVTLTDFSVTRADQNTQGTGHSKTCKQVAIATELHDNGSSTVVEICGGREREATVYMSMTNTVAIQFNQSNAQHVIIKYQAVGCVPLLAPPNTWVSRKTEQTTSFQCNWTDETWHLTCLGFLWIGEIGNCSSLGPDSVSIEEKQMTSFPWQPIPFLFIGLFIATTGFILLLFAKRRTAANKRRTNANDTAIPHPNSIYEDIGYDSIDVLQEDVVNMECPVLRADSMYEHVGYEPIDFTLEEAITSAKINQSTEKSKEVNPYMDLAPDPVSPAVYTSLRAGDYLILEN